MENSTLYDLLSDKLLQEWRDDAEENDGCIWEQREKDILRDLNEELTEKGKILLSSYSLAIENKLDFLYYNLSIKILNIGIKIGMELQTAFTEFEEK